LARVVGGVVYEPVLFVATQFPFTFQVYMGESPLAVTEKVAGFGAVTT